MEESSRACGPCDACCVAKNIPAVPSPAWSRCPHLRTAPAPGCGIHETRPTGCRHYSCAWLDGWGDAGDRPDLLGLIFEMAPGPVGGLEVRAIELTPGALEGSGATKIREWIATGARVRILRHGRDSGCEEDPGVLAPSPRG